MMTAIKLPEFKGKQVFVVYTQKNTYFIAATNLEKARAYVIEHFNVPNELITKVSSLATVYGE